MWRALRAFGADRTQTFQSVVGAPLLQTAPGPEQPNTMYALSSNGVSTRRAAGAAIVPPQASTQSQQPLRTRPVGRRSRVGVQCRATEEGSQPLLMKAMASISAGVSCTPYPHARPLHAFGSLSGR